MHAIERKKFFAVLTRGNDLNAEKLCDFASTSYNKIIDDYNKIIEFVLNRTFLALLSRTSNTIIGLTY